jgi:hypothetical protein
MLAALMGSLKETAGHFGHSLNHSPFRSDHPDCDYLQLHQQ